MRGKILRVYIDTSVIGGCIDQEFAPWSNGLMRDFREGTFIPVLSDLLAAEIGNAPPRIQSLHNSLLEMNHELLATGIDSVNLADVYQQRQIVTPKYYDDGLHIALATIAEVDVVVSWNFKHIVRLNKIRLFNAVNLELGYKQVEIYSPREVTNYEENI